MDIEDPPCVVGVSCRLPGGVQHFNAVWDYFSAGNWELSHLPPPASRNPVLFSSPHIDMRGGWLGEEGIEQFDNNFFSISNAEASNLRPNIRLALELTYEVIENAGIPPSSLRGQNIAVVVGAGTEDGWDMRQWQERQQGAFGRDWAANSDPSGISGYISHSFDFRGSSTTVSAACASAAFALRDGINALFREDSSAAVVGSLTTHLTPAPFGWAAAAGVLSPSGRCAAFSPQADGYSPSEGAVFFLLKKLSAAQKNGDPIYGIIRSIATGHYGTTPSIMTPNMEMQVKLFKESLSKARISADDISLVEGHATGTLVGDALEAESIHAVYGSRSSRPVVLSSSKTVTGHCHGAAASVGLLKVLACLERRCVPPHHVPSRAEFLTGGVIIPQENYHLPCPRLLAQVNAFGFTGSIASIIIEEAPHASIRSSSSITTSSQLYLLPFSAKSPGALAKQIRTVSKWAIDTQCPLATLAGILSICRDHHDHRRAFVIDRFDMLQTLAQADDNSFFQCLSSSSEDVFLDVLNPPYPDALASTASRLACDGNVLLAARYLYEGGHNLNFHSIYLKSNLNSTLIRAFPSYPFDRQRHWNDSPHPDLSRLAGANITPYNSADADSVNVTLQKLRNINQTHFRELVERFGRPFVLPHVVKPICHTTRYYLLTGANGLLGSQLLDRLLREKTCVVYCIIRGDPWSRLLSAFEKNELDSSLLSEARSDGRLILMHTTNLCGRRLGLQYEDYAKLKESMDHVVHAAWSVDFSLPLEKFYPFLEGTRHIAELCLYAKKVVRFHFIGSYASTFNYPGGLVPESVHDIQLSYSLAQGYAVSKLIAEHVLVRLQQAHSTHFHLSIIRVGQICGNTSTGLWSQNEMLPMIIASIPALKIVPASMPDVSWIPSDTCASTIRDMICDTRLNDVQILHVANPARSEWSVIAAEIGHFIGTGPPLLVSFEDYIKAIEQQDAPLPISRLLPYLTTAVASGSMPESYASLEVKMSLKYSSSLSTCPPIDAALISVLVKNILQNTSIIIEKARETKVALLFGPSSHEDLALASDDTDSLIALADEFQMSIGHKNLLDSSYPLRQQLTTLAIQLSRFESLQQRGLRPSFVLGYCFGEYAASVTSGMLSKRSVVEILVRRAAAIVEANTHGAMLNVFADIQTIRRCLSSIHSPPSIAIHVGPGHFVLSGSSSRIFAAKEQLNLHGVKCVNISTSLPFHSSSMDAAVRHFLQGEHSRTPAVDTDVTFVSGVTAAPLNARHLGGRYWMSHLRRPVDFHGAMSYLRQKFSGTIVDVGPGKMLSSIIQRYEWDDVRVVSFGNADDLTAGVKTYPHTGQNLPNSKATDALPLPSLTGAEHYAEICLHSMKELFGYEPSPHLLEYSLQSLGLQSMDFIRFADYIEVRIGVKLSLSAFVSGSTIREVLSNVPTQ